MRVLSIVLTVLLVSPGVLADDLGDATDRLLEAHRSRDPEAWRACLRDLALDPWLVADELCGRGEAKTALALARAVEGPGTERLAAFVESRSAAPEAPARAVLARVRQAFSRGDLAAVVASTEGIAPDSVVTIRLAEARGEALMQLRRPEESVAVLRRAVDAAQRLGWLSEAADALSMAGVCAYYGEDLESAVALTEEGLALAKKLSDAPRQARFLGNLGNLVGILGNHGRERDLLTEALGLFEKLEDWGGVSSALTSLGLCQEGLGVLSEALRCHERALAIAREHGLRLDEARALGNLGALLPSLGDHRRSIEVLEQAHRLFVEIGDPEGEAISLANLGAAKKRVGKHTEAARIFVRALGLFRALNDQAGVARILGSLGVVFFETGRFEEALAYLDKSLAIRERLGNPAEIADGLVNRGLTLVHLDRGEEAVSNLERSLSLLEDFGSVENRIHALWGLAGAQFDLGRDRDVIRTARRATSELQGFAGGLGADEGLGVREEFADVFDIGFLAAARLGDEREAWHFLESDRAISLLDMLELGSETEAGLVPPGLRKGLLDARRAEADARDVLAGTLLAGDEAAASAARDGLEKARGRVRLAIQKIQREAKAGSSLLLPAVDPVDRIRPRLREDEALVAYALAGTEAHALVVTRTQGRIVSLGDSDEIVRVCEETVRSAVLRQRGVKVAESAGVSPERLVDDLARRLVAPLGLPPEIRRLLVSPEGAIGRVPFVLLAGDREVAYVPSATVHGLLSEAGRSPAGSPVLALGDPDYRRSDLRLTGIRTSLVRPEPLPGSRAEARAVGDVVLLGAKASEAALEKALKTRDRWRAVHFACHGFFDAERPASSALALTPDARNDGFISCADVFAMRFPADLVVLGACETGRGASFRTEGIVGFTRAFMMAGAPRVLCSIWKVDDEATRELMTRFYELWNPDDRSEAVPAATALRRAQEQVRNHADHPEWRHPVYWASWQLWGRPD